MDATKLYLRIDGKWVNATAWSKTHPGGAEPLQRYSGQDATDAFAALHSEEAWEQVRKMKAVEVPDRVKNQCTESTSLEKNFRALREQLKKDGWFERNWIIDFAIVLHLFVLGALATYLAPSHPFLATIILGVCMQQAGWVGHDYSHGRGQISYWFGQICSGFFNAFSRDWWSRKHNTHHVHPNQIGVDDDISNEPILHIYVPKDVSEDFYFRRYQHLYYHFAYAFLYVSWRIQSLQTALASANFLELMLMLVNYVWLFGFLPLNVAIGGVLVGGLLVAEVVTASHQSEEMCEGVKHDFVLQQFLTTRDVWMMNPLLNYLWGGMQYQLIHHLFPTLPRYYYRSLVPIVDKFAKENGIVYKRAGMIEILKLNYETMRRYALPLEQLHAMDGTRIKKMQ